MMARLAVQQAIWAQSAACGRRCPNYCRIQDAAKYAGIRTLMPESVLDQYDASAPYTSISNPIRSMPGYDNIVQTDVAILVHRALREIGEDLEVPEGNAPVGMRT